jgi:hypothetical protein
MENNDRKRRMSLKYESTKLLRFDDIGTVRTGLDWFNRYMTYPWERDDFKLATQQEGG